MAHLRDVFLPHYMFRPIQLVRRIARRVRGSSADAVTVTMPWGASIRCRSRDAIGLSLQQLGVFELGVAETLWRLADPGELAVDVGGNVGQMTAILAHRVGATGRVLVFEPNAHVRTDLEFNVDVWRRAGCDITLHPVALSDHEGEGVLVFPPFYEWNQGTAFVAAGPAAHTNDVQMRVSLARLDRFLADGLHVGVAKIDVEGHEAAVLRGASEALAEHRIRDLVYEAHAGYPDAVSALLEPEGYHVFAVGSGFLGPRCRPAREGPVAARWESPSFLATLDPGRALARLRPRGWRVL
jgi:FkbM family methyltransferase